jgi:hypothetical protein
LSAGVGRGLTGESEHAGQHEARSRPANAPDRAANWPRRIITARGRNIGAVATRRLLTLVYYGLRDGEIRALAARAG